MSEETTTEQSQTSNTSPESTPQPNPTPNPTPSQDNSKLCAILSYLLVGIIWYFADEELKKNEFAKFHVKQATVLIIISVLASFVMGATIILIPFVFLLNLAALVLMIVGIVNAANGDKKELPIIGSLANQFLKF